MSVSNIFLVTGIGVSFGGGKIDPAAVPADPFWCAVSADFNEPLKLGNFGAFPLWQLLAKFFNDPCPVELSGIRLPRVTSPTPMLGPPPMLAAFKAKLLSEPVFLRSFRKLRGICPRLNCCSLVYCSCNWRCFLNSSWCRCSSSSWRDWANRFSIKAAVAAAELLHFEANNEIASKSIVPNESNKSQWY